MLRVLFVSSVFISVVYIIYALIMIESVADKNAYSMYDMYIAGHDYSDFTSATAQLTKTAALVSAVFVLFHFVVCLISLKRIRTKTMRAISITGIILSAFTMLPVLRSVINPAGAAFDKAGYFAVLLAITALASSIIGTIHAFKTQT